MSFNHGSVFTGIGGFDLAAEWVGWNNVFQVEIDEYCQKVLIKNFPNAKRYKDIKEFDGTRYGGGAIDVLSGGFPCTDISWAKSWTSQDEFKENGINGKRSGLWSEYGRIIYETTPKFVVIENVAALQKQGLDVVLQTLTDIGYNAEWAIITSAHVGAPHLRKRIWIVAYPISIGRGQESIIFSEEFSQKIRYSSQWQLSRTICKTYRKKTLPESFGIHDGIPRGLDDDKRMKALGNAIVPQIALEIYRRIDLFLKNHDEKKEYKQGSAKRMEKKES